MALLALDAAGTLPVPVDQVGALITYAATGVLVGGRMGYCIYLHPECSVLLRIESSKKIESADQAYSWRSYR